MRKEISPDNKKYIHLDAAQLVKHLLGLTRCCKRGFRLVYLYYDVPGPAGAKHGEEVRDFAALARQDGIAFSFLTYQDLFVRLSLEYYDGHREYIDYIAERYL